MIHGPQNLSRPLQLLVVRALSLCELILPHTRSVFPFAAIYENGKIGCLFTDERAQGAGKNNLIEQLQWRIIDTTTDTESYSVLVYSATVKTDHNKSLDAIAINAGQPNDEETILLYPYFRVGNRIVVSPPISR
ncbi:hypothetical protein DXV75_00610 [Alteromonas aestuariivivens]|uniref:Uncharacterized protein n=1 Tax=Alteromonas aestuariivivens TaxID=1938339 RepID=A0A3D8MER8_9ALTE|nr:hypothetical protein [Alteromonas aestuariivivens]RDV29004.1 hypothetical protein DXV75_00610 [Alteromonas aestuariivivens]